MIVCLNSRIFKLLHSRANLKEEMTVSASGKLRVLILLNRIPFPLNDGGAIGAFSFVKGYAESGAEVTALAMNTAKHFVERSLLKDSLLKYATLHDVYIDNKIKPVNALLNLFTGESYLIERFKSKVFDAKLQELLQQNNFDVVHIDGLPPALYIPTIRKFSKAFISMRAHNVEHVIWKRVADSTTNIFKKWYVGLQAKQLSDFEFTALEQTDVTMAISREDEQTIKNFCPAAKTIIVPASMDIDDECPKGNTEVNPLFFIGSFDWMPNEQGVEWFIDVVWNRLSSAFPNLKFVIAGKKMSEKMKALKTEKLLPIGEVPDATEFVLKGGIMVVPIISGSGIRIKILEGMALGKCIVATTIAVEGLGLTDGENVLIADNADEFIEKIGKCLSDTAYREKIAKNAHTFALENFQNKKVFDKLTAFYRQQL